MELTVKLTLTSREKKLLTMLAIYMEDEACDLQEDGDIEQRKRGDKYKEAVEVLNRLIRLSA